MPQLYRPVQFRGFSFATFGVCWLQVSMNDTIKTSMRPPARGSVCVERARDLIGPPTLRPPAKRPGIFSKISYI